MPRAHRADPLYGHRGQRAVNHAVLIGHHVQPAQANRQKLPRAQQKCGISRPAKDFVADGKSLGLIALVQVSGNG